jgi:hypothetical protein
VRDERVQLVPLSSLARGLDLTKRANEASRFVARTWRRLPTIARRFSRRCDGDVIPSGAHVVELTCFNLARS